MKKNTGVLLSSVGLLMYSSICLAETDCTDCTLLPYFRIDSGFGKFENLKGTSVQGASSKLTSTIHSTVGAGLGIGINFGDKVRSDITWSRHINPVLHSDSTTRTITRRPLVDVYFLNFYYELGNLISIFHPYVGAGVGVATLKDKLSILPIGGNDVAVSEVVSKKNNFAYKFAVGSAFDLNDSIKFDISYSFNDYGKTKSRLDILGNQLGKSRYRASIVSAGLRFGM